MIPIFCHVDTGAFVYVAVSLLACVFVFCDEVNVSVDDLDQVSVIRRDLRS